MIRTGIQLALFGRPFWRFTKALGIAVVPVLGCLALSPGVAKADVYLTLNATIGNNVGHNVPVAGITGLTLTGTLDLTDVIDEVTTNAADIKLQGNPNLFTEVLSCGIYLCATIANTGFAEYGLLDIGNPNTFEGGALGPNSELTIGSNPYHLTGTLTPEPGFYGALALGMIGLLVAFRRRRRQA
jgi:MYXO-CTERM domain-containing protein